MWGLHFFLTFKNSQDSQGMHYKPFILFNTIIIKDAITRIIKAYITGETGRGEWQGIESSLTCFELPVYTILKMYDLYIIIDWTWKWKWIVGI